MVADAMQALFRELHVIDCSLNRRTRTFDRIVGLHRLFRYASLAGGTLIFGSASTGWLQGLEFISQRAIPLFTFGTGVIDPDFINRLHQLTPDVPLLDPSHLDCWLACLRRFQFVAVRGVESQRILHEHGFDNTEVIGDPALHFARPRILPKQRQKRIGINLSQYSYFWNNSQAQVTAACIELIRTLLNDQWTITLFSTIPEDRLLSEGICRNSHSDRIHLHTGMFDPHSWLDAVEDLDVFLGVKLHSVVTAFCTYTPAIMVGYQPKCLDFMRTIGMERLHIRSDLVSGPHLVDAVLSLYDNIDSVQREQFTAVQHFKMVLDGFRVRVLRHIGVPLAALPPAKSTTERAEASPRHLLPTGHSEFSVRVSSALSPESLICMPTGISRPNRSQSQPPGGPSHRLLALARSSSMAMYHSILKLLRANDARRWTHEANLDPAWDERTVLIAKMIEPGSKVLEFGAGRLILREHLAPGCQYTPSDLVDRSDETLVCDLNAEQLPPIGYHEVLVFGGVLEYVFDIERLLARLQSHCHTIIASYAVIERRSLRRIIERRSRGWVNDLSTEDLLRLVRNAGFEVVDRRSWGQQVIFKFSKMKP